MPFKLLFMLFVLYGIQGIPYGVQSRFLPIYLRSQNFSLSVLGFIKLLYIPWLLKTFYAPLIDSIWTKITWLKISVFLLSVTSFFISLISSESYILLFLALLCLNLFSATQDIALDGFMISKLSHSDLGIGNVAQVVGYKLGAVIGGGLLLFLSFYLKWSHLFQLITMTYLCAFISICFLKRIIISKSTDLKEVCPMNMTDYRTMLKDCLKSRGTKTVSVLVLMYKLGEQGALTLLPLFLLDCGYVFQDIGLWTGIVGQFSSVLGSSMAAFMSRYSGLWKTLYCLSIISLPVHIIFIVVVGNVVRSSTFYFGLCVFMMNLLLFIGGIRTTVTFSLMMQCSQMASSSIQSTHYTFLATMEVLGKLLFSSMIGVFADSFGYLCSYCLFLAPVLLTLCFLRYYREQFSVFESSNEVGKGS